VNDKALVLCAASMLGLLVWRYWLATQGAIRLRGSLAVWVLVGAAGVCAAASRYLLEEAYAAIAELNPADKASALADRLSPAMHASSAAMVFLAAGAMVLGGLTFAYRRREA